MKYLRKLKGRRDRQGRVGSQSSWTEIYRKEKKNGEGKWVGKSRK